MSTAEPGSGRTPPTTAQEGRREEMLDEEEVESFPASDPHSDWAGPPQPPAQPPVPGRQ